ncbi:MAG: hypothetical protein F4X92_02545, partial [Gammaproteobacteria bacterium]|nr:hypothetical protein [Gammaproteobacteria bacterium]
MSIAKLHRLHESGSFEWPWDSPNGLLILRGAAGGGGGGGGIDQGNPVPGIHGWGCKHGDGGNGGQGGNILSGEGQIASIGGNGGKGFPGETLIFELSSLVTTRTLSASTLFRTGFFKAWPAGGRQRHPARTRNPQSSGPLPESTFRIRP